MFRGAEVGEGPETEMRGIAVVGMGEFGESCGGPQEEGVSKRGFVNKAQHCREFQEVRSESRSEPAKAERAWERGRSGCRHDGLQPGLS